LVVKATPALDMACSSGAGLLLIPAIPRYWNLASTWVAARSKQAAQLPSPISK
jgi:hypothetical protein